MIDKNLKVAVITGASSGIGAATAKVLTQNGYSVALLARRIDEITKLANQVGNDSIAIETDVTDRDSLLAALKKVDSHFGRVDLLVNNAGVMLLGEFGPDRRDDYMQMIQVNLFGAITSTEVFLEKIKKSKGDIVNVSSVAGRFARPTNGVYAATKWGINGWSESLRQELLPDVRVIIIEPGAVDTELTSHITDVSAKKAAEDMYSKNSISPDDVADLIQFVVTRPRGVNINEVMIRPTGQA